MIFKSIFLFSFIGILLKDTKASITFSKGPCDIYSSGGTPCVAAHSTTRALYSSYNGALYQIMRKSDYKTQNVNVLTKGGIANSASQDSFCSGTTCYISMIYDQSGRNNHLSRALKGHWSGPKASGDDKLAIANAAPIKISGQKVYGVYISPGTGYRIDNTNGVATGNDPEGIYAVLDGTHYNANCCFDYGNAETSNTDTGNSHMEAIYFGSGTQFNTGSGSGPWIMADLENGLFNSNNLGYSVNSQAPSMNNRFVTGMVKGDSSNLWAVKGGNAQSGQLNTFWNGPRPDGYYPMNKEGAIILGIGGDNGNGDQGTFYEGVMTSGYPSDNIENLVQANIVSARYST